MNVTCTSGTTYDIQVDGFYGGSGNVILSWNEIVTSSEIPVITTQPASQTVAAGGLTMWIAKL